MYYHLNEGVQKILIIKDNTKQNRKNSHYPINDHCRIVRLTAVIGIICLLPFSHHAYSSNSWTKCRFSFKGRHATSEENAINLEQLSKQVDETNQQYSKALDQVNELLYNELVAPHKELIALHLDQKNPDQQLAENAIEYVENSQLLHKTQKVIFITNTKYNAKINQLFYIARLKIRLEETIQEHALFISQKVQKQIDHLNQQMDSYIEDYMK